LLLSSPEVIAQLVISSLDGYRLYPAVQSHPLHGVNIVATWHCSTVYTSTAAF